MTILAKYGAAFSFRIPIPLADDTDFAASGDWTPASGDVKISKDGGNVANVTTLPTAVGGTGSVLWSFSLSATEMQAAEIVIQVVDQDSSPAIENQAIVIRTYGNASASIVGDLDTPADWKATGFSTHNAANVRTEMDSNSTQLAAIVADTDELQTNQGNWLTASGFSTHSAEDVWAVASRTLSSFGTLVDDTAAAVWAIATSALTAAGTIGKLIVDYLDAAVSSRSSHDDPDPSGYIDASISSRSSHSASAVKTAMEAEGSYLDLVKGVTDNLALMIEEESSGGGPQYSADALVNAPSGSGTIDANLVSVDDQALGAKVGSNFNTFFQNGGVDTAKTVDLVGTASGGGDYSHTHTTDPSAQCWVYTDEAMTPSNLVNYGVADEFGEVTWNFSATGTYYVRHYRFGEYYPDDPEEIEVTA